MTKKDLILALEQYPDDMIICGFDGEYSEHYEINQVQEEQFINGHITKTDLDGKVILALL